VTRALAVMLGGLLLGGAGPRVPLPLPPPLPADPPADQAAPVPDVDVLAPGTFAPGQSAAVWALRIYRMQEFGTGEGYIPGSEYQSPEQRKPLQTPGFIVTVPLQ
jgi:hypothetical protein